MNDQLTYCKNIDAISQVKSISLRQMSLEAEQKPGFAAKSKDPRNSMSIYRLLANLHRNHGVHAPEMFVPPVQWRGDDIGGGPSNPHLDRPEVGTVVNWMQTVGDDWQDDPMLSFMTIFFRPKRAKSTLKTAAVGRMSLLAIEGGVSTPEKMDALIDNSPDEFFKASALMVGLKAGETLEAPPRQQTLYVPPDRFISCVVSPVICRKDDYILHYAKVNAHALKRKPTHEMAGEEIPALLETQDFERQ